MHRSARTWLIGLTAASLATGTLMAAAAAPAAATASPAASVRAAVDTARATERFQYVVSSTISGTAVKATGRVDLPSNRTAVEVSVGGQSTEFRRIGAAHYLDAKRLGATGTRWVSLGQPTGTSEVPVRSVTSLVASMSPQSMLAFLKSTTSATRIGRDAYGTRYRIGSPQSRAAFLPMITMFGAPTSGPASQVEAWIDARGRLSRATVTGQGFSSLLTLSGFGSAVSIPAPTASTTGSVQSVSGRFVFGTGYTLPLKPATAPTLTASPTVEYVDGILRGRVNAVSSTGQNLRLEPLPASKGGKMAVANVPTGQGRDTDPQSFTVLPYADWLDGGVQRGLENFPVRVREVTPVDAYLTGIPLIGRIASPVLDLMQVLPGVSDQFAYVVGRATTAQVPVNVGELAPGDTPVAFTRRVEGYRGTLISTNFFPASGLAPGGTAPLVLQGAALGEPGSTNPYQAFDAKGMSPGTAVLRTPQSNGQTPLNVITWDPRGTYGSGGLLQLNDPFFEGVDVSSIISWAAARTPVALNGAGDPAVGMTGGSYGGGIQLVVGATDPRIDAITPGLTWNSLIDSLQPNGVLSTEAASSLLRTLDKPQIRVNPALIAGLRDGIATGRLSDATLSLLASRNLNPLLNQIQAPALLWQSTSDPVLPVSQSLATAQQILANPYGTPVNIGWVDDRAATDAAIANSVSGQSVAWLLKYVVGAPIPDPFFPVFQWWDQLGQRQTSPLYPFSDGFNAAPFTGQSSGGSITVTAPGAAPGAGVAATVPVADGAEAVGLPTLSFSYSGTGTARSVSVRITDAGTGEDLAPVSLVPLQLDGRSRTVAVPLNGITFTGTPGSAIRVTVSGATPASAPRTTGTLSVSDVRVDVPQRATS